MPDSMSHDQFDALRSAIGNELGQVETSLETDAFAQEMPILGTSLQDAFQQGQAELHSVQGLATAIEAGLASLDRSTQDDTASPLTSGAVFTSAVMPDTGSNAIGGILASTVQDSINQAIAASGFQGQATVTVDDNNVATVHLGTGLQSKDFTLSLAHDLGLDGAKIQTTGNVDATINYQLDTTLSVDLLGDQVTNPDPSTPVLTASLNVADPKFSADATFGSSKFTATDTGTSLSGSFQIAGNGATTWTGDAKIGVALAGDLGTPNLPSFSANLDGDWSFQTSKVDPTSTAPFGSLPTLSLDDVTIDAGQYFRDVLLPLLNQIMPYLAPIQQVLDVLNADIPWLKTLLGPTTWHALDQAGAFDADGNEIGDGKLTLLDLLKLANPAIDLVSITRAAQTIQQVTGLLTTLEGLNNGTAVYDLGSFNLSGDIRDPTYSLLTQLPIITKAADSISALFAGLPGTLLSAGAAGLTAEADLEALTTLTNPLKAPIFYAQSAFKTLLGQSSDLFELDIPRFDLGFGSIAADGSPLSTITLGGPYVVAPGITITLNGALTASAAIDLGFDESGLRDYAAGGFTDPSKALDGIWISNPGDQPVLQLQGSVGLNVEGGFYPVAYIEGGGDITGSVEFYLDSAGRNYLPDLEAAQAEGSLYFEKGQLTAGFDASVDAIGATFWSYHSPRLTLATFGAGDESRPSEVPYVTSVTLRTLDGVPGVTKAVLIPGQYAQFLVQFNRAVTPTGAALVLNDDGRAQYDAAATAAIGDPTEVVFTYQVTTAEHTVPALIITGPDKGTNIVESGDPSNETPRQADLSNIKGVAFDDVQVDTALTRTFLAAAGDFDTQANWSIPYDASTLKGAAFNLFGDAVIAAGNTATYDGNAPDRASMESLTVKPTATLDIAGGTLEVTYSPKQDSRNDGAIVVQQGATFALGDDLVDTGTVELAATAAYPVATLLLEGPQIVLSGGGTITLDDAVGNRIISGPLNRLVDSDSATVTLQNVDNTIVGAGSIGVAGSTDTLQLVNAATILARGANPLTLYAPVTNTGTLGAQGTGRAATPTAGLVILGMISNDGGTILAEDGGQVVLGDGSTLTGGTISTPDGDTALVTTQGKATIGGGGDAIAVAGRLLAGSGSTLAISGPVNATASAILGALDGGTLECDDALLSGGHLQTSGTGLIVAMGTLDLTGAAENDGAVQATDSSDINVDDGVINRGTITALGTDPATLEREASVVVRGSLDNAGGTLTASTGGIVELATGAVVSGGTLSTPGDSDAASVISQAATLDGRTARVTVKGILATAGAATDTLTLEGDVDLAAAKLIANAGNILLSGARLVGGTLQADAETPGEYLAIGAGNILDGGSSGISLDAVTHIDQGDLVTLRAAITNPGTIELAGGANGLATLLVDGAVSLAGGGEVHLIDADADPAQQLVQAAVSGAVLTNVDETIEGSGIIGDGTLGLVNQAAGTIQGADGGTLVVLATAPAGLVNQGTLTALAGSTLELHGAIANAGGDITGSSIRLVDATVTGGDVDVTGTSTFTLQNSTLSGTALTVATGGTLNVAGSSTIDGTGGTTLLNGLVSLRVANLKLRGPVRNAGTIQLTGIDGDPTGDALRPSSLLISGPVTLTGAGFIELYGDEQGVTPQRIAAADPSATLDNVDNTISAEGTLGDGVLAITNGPSGVIETGLAPLTIDATDPAGLVNAGKIIAGPGSTLEIDGAIHNAGGIILAAAGTIDANDATIDGGTIAASAVQGVFGTYHFTGSSKLSGVILGASLFVDPATSLTVSGTIVNGQSIAISGNSHGSLTTTLHVAGTVTLSGVGSVTLADSSGYNSTDSQVITGTASDTLVNQDNIISGYGLVGNGKLRIVNQGAGEIIANNGTLVLDSGASAITNAGLLQSMSGGALELYGAITGAGGRIDADGGVVYLNSTATTDGLFTDEQGGAIHFNGIGSIAGATNAATLHIDGGSILTLSGTITDPGTLAVDGNSHSSLTTTIDISGLTTLTGPGALSLSDISGYDVTATQVVTGTAADTLVNRDSTIRGYGLLGNGLLHIVNQAAATIQATGGTLVLDSGAAGTTNAGLLQAKADGVLELHGAITNSGTIDAAGGTVNLVGATITGGTLTSSEPGGVMHVAGTATLAALTNAAALIVDAGTTLTLSGAIANTGTIDIPGNSHLATTSTIDISGHVTLSGHGTLSFEDVSGYNQVFSQVIGGTGTLENVDNTITGFGLLGDGAIALTNDAAGTIDATGGTLELDTGANPVSNAGLLEATDGTLELDTALTNTGTLFAGHGGTVTIKRGLTGSGLARAGDGGTISLDGAIVTANLSSTALGTIEVASSATLDGTAHTIQLAGATVIEPAATLTLIGAIDNTGTIALDSNSHASQTATLIVQGTVTLSGGGTLTMQDTSGYDVTATQVVTGTVADTLVNRDSIIRGYGLLGNGLLHIVNQAAATIQATGGTLVLDSGAAGTTNAGLLQAKADGVLELHGAITNSGTIDAAGGTVNLVGATITGGTLTSSEPGGVMHVAGAATLAALTNAAALIVDAGTTLTLSGAIANTGTIDIPGNSHLATTSTIDISGHVTLSGHGTLSFEDVSGYNQVFSQVIGGTGTLENVDNTITGFGTITAALINDAAGSLVVTDALDVTGAFTNRGEIRLSGSTLATAGLANVGRIDGNGTISGAVDGAGTIEASGGTLAAAGAVSGALVVDAGATLVLEAGAAPGTTVDFTGRGGSLDIIVPAVGAKPFDGTVLGNPVGNVIDLVGLQATGSLVNGVMTLSAGGAVIGTVHVGTSVVATATSDGRGGTQLTFDQVDPLFDAAYYLAQNPDVAAAGADPYQHYMTYGWKEGRNPSALFNTSYYLNQNPDVAAAGANPLTHFELYGWKEGRDPSIAFSLSRYDAAYPDIKAANVDPLLHYVEDGKSEGRQDFAATPHATGVQDPLINAAYVYAQRPDVAAAGLDATAWYDSVGWTQGVNPDPDFDTNYYLAQNPDVRAAGANPLAHFESYGWKEGREPSLAFSDSQYLSVYGDIRAAGVDPLLHYVLDGQAEGRLAFLVGGMAAAADPLVDAAYYDAQLGATIVPAGSAGQEQAAASYDAIGWKNGLNPDAFFDTSYYLQHNPDVAAAHVDPLLHYELDGWKEGRDPSAMFSTTKYLNAYADVKAAGVDPLLHFIEFGQSEGRQAFSV